jgi:lycopene beta-cyclase
VTRTEDVYDFIVAGGGLSGLSLVCSMMQTTLRDRSILIVDRDPKQRNDRTWGFWANTSTLFDEVISHSWDRLQVVGEDEVPHLIPLVGGYRYHVIHGLHFYDHVREKLAPYENVTFLHGRVESIVDGRDAACVTVDGIPHYGRWVFNSLPQRTPADQPYQYLKMHFRGWEVQTETPAFDPETVTFMDFRTPQAGEMRFFYVLPYAADRALVEYTLFSETLLQRSVYEEALRTYLAQELKIASYEVVAVESGVVPLTDDPLLRALGKRIMAIGARAGRIKPSTGYAFIRVQRDCEEIIHSLLLHGHPFDVSDDPDLHDILDAVLLKVIAQRGDHFRSAFGAMFKRNPIDSILRFLDESSTPGENLRLIASMPPGTFIKAFFQLATSGTLLDITKG